MRTVLLVVGFIGAATLAIVIFTSAQASARQLLAVQKYISEGIVSKGRVLTESHAHALRGLTLDNAFLDIQALVDRAVQEDPDLVYGLYVNAELVPLAFSRHGRVAPSDAAANKDAWRVLALPEAELVVRKPIELRTTRLGEQLVEVAYPVFGEGAELVGTIRYGLSTHRMQEALTQAKADSKARLTRSVALVASLITLASALGLLLSRQQAVRITDPVAKLTQAALQLSAGNRAVRVEVNSGDEIEQLGASFNRMVEDLDASYRELERMNRTLEQKVEERTLELAQKNRDSRLVLDNVDQGFITLGTDGVMVQERSRVVDQWFGSVEPNTRFTDYFAPMSRGFALSFGLAWDQLIEDVLPPELCVDQLPRQLQAGGRTWSFRYLPFQRAGKLDGALVVIAEITERLAKEREEAEHGELMQGFKRLMLDRSGFNSFLADADKMVSAIVLRTLEHDGVVHRRTLHTLKGNAASMGLVVVGRICHGLEQELAENGRIPDAALAELAARWRAICEHVAHFMGNQNQKVIEVPEAEYASLVARLSGLVDQSDVLDQVLTWQLEPVSKPLRRLAEQGQALARRLEKDEIQVEIQGNGVRLDPEAYGSFFAELVHVVRNSVDHGIERSSEREAKHKPRFGTLVLKAQTAGNYLVFEISDDGRGIDWDALAERARERGLPAETQADLLQALCSDGVTTRAQVTEVSGRGVGMAAFKQAVDALGGRIEVRSSRGVGTSWIVRLPWSAEGSRRPRRGQRESTAPSAHPQRTPS